MKSKPDEATEQKPGLEAIERSQIKARLQQAGFEVTEKPELLLITCPRYTIAVYFSEEFGQWRITPYNHQVEQIVRSPISEATHA